MVQMKRRWCVILRDTARQHDLDRQGQAAKTGSSANAKVVVDPADPMSHR